MIPHPEEGRVLRAGQPGDRVLDLRRRSDRRHLFTAVIGALLLHILVVLAFWMVDILGFRDISDWTGPVLVKIGAPEAQESQQPDPGPLPDQPEEPQPEAPEVPEAPVSPPEDTSSAESAPAQPEPSPQGTRQDIPDTPSENAGTGEAAESPFQEARPTAPPAPARVRGEEDGNNYFIDFEGSDGEVGRAGAYDFISNYMPLPEFLESSLMENAQEYLAMSPAFIRGELGMHWEPGVGGFVKKRGAAGAVPLKDRPYYWGILIHSLGFDPQDADWIQPGMRPVVVEFMVTPSQGAWGASLTDIRVVSRSNDPKIDEAVVYGLSRWVYYNKTDQPIRARMTYNFDR